MKCDSRRTERFTPRDFNDTEQYKKIKEDPYLWRVLYQDEVCDCYLEKRYLNPMLKEYPYFIEVSERYVDANWFNDEELDEFGKANRNR